MFLLFAGNDYCPHGGAYDFKGSFDSVADAQEHCSDEWATVFDTETLTVCRSLNAGVWKDGGFEIVEIE